MLEAFFYPLFFDGIIAVRVNLKNPLLRHFPNGLPDALREYKGDAQSSEQAVCCRIGKPYTVELKKSGRVYHVIGEKQAWFDIHQQGRKR